ncbi:hypothetical protein [Spirosoma telluris]
MAQSRIRRQRQLPVLTDTTRGPYTLVVSAGGGYPITQRTWAFQLHWSRHTLVDLECQAHFA